MKQENLQHNQEMFQIVKRWEQSGNSIRAFSNSEGIPYEKLRYWKNKILGPSVKSKQKLTKPQNKSLDFISVEIPDSLIDFSGFQIAYPNNVKITCPAGIEFDTLKSLIKLF